MSENAINPEAMESRKEESSVEKLREQLQNIVDGTRAGTLELAKPIRADGEDVGKLRYDFGALNGWEYADAMDRAGAEKPDAFHVTQRQALSLFAAAAAKATDHVDSADILAGIGMEDGIKAAQVAQLFFNAASRLGDLRSSRA